MSEDEKPPERIPFPDRPIAEAIRKHAGELPIVDHRPPPRKVLMQAKLASGRRITFDADAVAYVLEGDPNVEDEKGKAVVGFLGDHVQNVLDHSYEDFLVAWQQAHLHLNPTNSHG